MNKDSHDPNGAFRTSNSIKQNLVTKKDTIVSLKSFSNKDN